jgi:DNA-binding winged helix-turn-helix (wHTH) protein/tetratricopeptide (TPR) repeat protein
MQHTQFPLAQAQRCLRLRVACADTLVTRCVAVRGLRGKAILLHTAKDMTVLRYRFHDFELDAGTRELRHANGHVVVLPARVFDCVLHLIEQRERAVGRDELVAVVWNRMNVGDNVLGQLLARTRKLLNDTGDQQRIIRTIPGFGYHWIAPTESIGEATKANSRTPTAKGSTRAPHDSSSPMGATSSTVNDAGTTWHGSRRHIGVGLVVIALSLMSVTAFLMRSPSSLPIEQPATTIEKSLPPPSSARPALILPAQVEASGGEEWLRLGIMAFVNERLATAGQPTVSNDSAVALISGMNVTALDDAGYSALADLALANIIIQPRVERVGASEWRVGLDIVHGGTPARLSVAAESDQVLDAAHEATNRLLAGLGIGSPLANPGDNDPQGVVLKQAQSAYLDGKPEIARKLLSDAYEQHPDLIDLGYQLALMEYSMGQLDAAAARLEYLETKASAQDDPLMLARIYNALANVSYQHREFDRQQRYSQQTIDLLEDRTDGKKELGQAWREQGVIANSQGRYQDSLANFARARVLLATNGDWLEVARVDGMTGFTLQHAGRLHESLSTLDRAASRLRQFHNAWFEGVVRAHIADINLKLAEPGAALAQEPRMRELDEQIEHPGMRSSLKLARADILMANGRLSEARRLVEPSYAAILARNDRLNTYYAHAMAARLAATSGNSDKIVSEARQAIATLDDPEEDPRHVAWTYVLLIGEQAANNIPAAEASCRELAKRIDRRKPEDPAPYVHLARAVIAAAQDEDEEARAAFEESFVTGNAMPIDLLRTAHFYVPWLIQHGEGERAAEIVGRLSDLPSRNFDAAVLELRVYRAAHQEVAAQGALDRARALAGERKIPEELLAGESLAR